MMSHLSVVDLVTSRFLFFYNDIGYGYVIFDSIILRFIPFSPIITRTFFHEGMLCSVKGLFLYLQDEHVISVYIHMVYHMDGFAYVEPFLHFWDNANLHGELCV